MVKCPPLLNSFNVIHHNSTSNVNVQIKCRACVNVDNTPRGKHVKHIFAHLKHLEPMVLSFKHISGQM